MLLVRKQVSRPLLGMALVGPSSAMVGYVEYMYMYIYIYIFIYLFLCAYYVCMDPLGSGALIVSLTQTLKSK